MIIIIVKAIVKKENISLFEERLTSVSNAALRLEGCSSYQWYRNLQEEAQYVVYGEFQSMKHFTGYKKSPVVERIVNQVIPLTVSKPCFKHFQGEIFEHG